MGARQPFWFECASGIRSYPAEVRAFTLSEAQGKRDYARSHGAICGPLTVDCGICGETHAIGSGPVGHGCGLRHVAQ